MVSIMPKNRQSMSPYILHQSSRYDILKWVKELYLQTIIRSTIQQVFFMMADNFYNIIYL